MPVFENESHEQLKQRLWRSSEVQHYIYSGFLILIIPLLVCGILFLRFAGIAEHGLLRKVTAIVMTVYCFPLLAFYGYRLVSIFRKWKHYRYYQVKLTSLHSSYWLRGSRYTVVLQEHDGSQRIVNTHYIFSPRGLTNPSLDEYAGKTAVVGYNEETGQVVFLG